MISLFICIIAFFLIGWDTWSFEAFNPLSDFTQQGLAWHLAATHSYYGLSLFFLFAGWCWQRKKKFQKVDLLATLMLLAAALFYAIQPSFSTSGGARVDFGLGALIYFSGLMAIAGKAVAKRGWLAGDSFSAQAVLLLSSYLFLFIFYPIVSIFKLSFFAQDTFSVSHFVEKLSSYGLLQGIYWNTLQLALLVSFVSTLIAIGFALVVVRSRFEKMRPVFRAFSLMPMITPPFVVGLSFIFLFGRSGLITHGLLGLDTAVISGFLGLALSQIISFTPLAFMVIVGVLEGIDPTMEEASFALRGNHWMTFKNVTWKLLRPGVANAFLLTMIESFADFANPMIIGGDYNVLSTEIYIAVVGKYDTSLAASLGIILLVSTLVFFLLQQLWLGKKSFVTVTGKPQGRSLPKLPKKLGRFLIIFCSFWALFTMSLYVFFFFGGFVKIWGIDHTFTWEHYQQFFLDGFESFKTTLWLAFLAAPFTALAGLLIAYLIKRKNFFGRSTIEFVSLVSFAIPGTVVGIGYMMAFHEQPWSMTGTAMILIFCFVFRNMPVGIRAGVALFSQIDRSLEDASMTLRATTAQTLRKILFPLAEGAVVAAVITAFIRAITAISAVVFLVSAEHNLATKVILDRIEYGKLGQATAYCTILVIFMALVVFISQWLIKRLSGSQMRKLVS